MKALIDNRPFPVCILRSGDPARDHRPVCVAETFAQLAGVASARLGVEGDTFRAAALEGVSVEARRQMTALEAV